MKKLQRIIGMSQHQIAHTAPLASIPQLQQKKPKSSTLIEKCLKSMIKERMAGHLINKERKDRYYESQDIQNTDVKNMSLEHKRKLKSYMNSSRYETPKKNKSLQSVNYRNIRQLSLNKEQYKGKDHHPSFISAIEEESGRKNYGTETDSAKKQLYAKAMKEKNDKTVSQLFLPEISKRRKSVNLVEKKAPVKNLFKNPEDNVSIQLWNILCQNRKPKEKKRKPSFKDDLNQSATKSTLLKRNRQTTTKEQVMLFITELPTCLRKIIQSLFVFFDVKLPNQLNLLAYGKLLESLKSVQLRGWSFFAFCFWDVNKDGLLTSQDIFQHFKEFHLSQNSQNSRSMNIPFVKQASELFLRLMNKLNNNFPLKTFEQSSQNPEESENIKYLEEVILTKKDIKFKEIQNILSSGEENKGSAPQISLFPKDLTVKCSSSYRQCFIATEHNEQTRLSRQQIENYKFELKKIKINRNKKIKENQEEQKRSIKYITYENFIQNGYGKQVKKIVYMILGII